MKEYALSRSRFAQPFYIGLFFVLLLGIDVR